MQNTGVLPRDAAMLTQSLEVGSRNSVRLSVRLSQAGFVTKAVVCQRQLILTDSFTERRSNTQPGCCIHTV